MTIVQAGGEEAAPRPEEGGHYDAFVSYQRDDLVAVEQMRDALRDRGKFVWIDVDYDNIPPGTQWEDRIKRGIEACNAFVFVISPRSTASEACRGELRNAVELHKLIIPVVHRFVPPSELPEPVAQTQWIALEDTDTWTAGIDLLVEALGDDVEWRDEHTRYAGLAREWLDHTRDASYLLRGRDLRNAEGWLSAEGGHRERPTDQQREYIAVSRKAAVRRQRILVGGLAAGFVIAISLAVYALIQRASAIHETHVAESQLRADQALLLSSSGNQLTTARLDEALLLDLEANRLDPSAIQVRSAMTAALETARESGADAILGPGASAQAAEAVTASPDGRMLAVGAADGTVRVFDVARRTLIATASDRTGVAAGAPVTSLAFAPGGETLVVAGGDGLQVFALAHGQLEREGAAPGGIGGVNSVAFAPAGATLAAGRADGSVHLYTLAHGTLSADGSAQVGGAATTGVASVAFAPGGRVLATGDGYGFVSLFRISPGRLHPLGSVQTDNYTTSSVTSLSFGRGGRLLAAASVDERVHLLAVAHGTLRAVATDTAGQPHLNFQREEEGVTSVAFAPGGRALATGSGDGMVRLFGVRHDRLALVDTLAADSSGDISSVGVTSVAFTREGTLAVAAGDGLVRLFATTDGALAPPGAALAATRYEPIDGVAFGASGRMLAIADGMGTVRLLSVSNGAATLRRVLRTGINPPTDMVLSGQTALAFASDGRLAIGGNDGGLEVLAVAGGRPTVQYRGAPGSVTSLAFAPGAATLAAAAGSGLSLLRFAPQVGTRSLHATITAGPSSAFNANAVAFAPDGRGLATAGGDGYVRMFAASHGHLTPAGKSLATSATDLTKGVDQGVSSVAFATGGSMLAAGSADGQVFLFDVAARRLTLLDSRYVGPNVAVDTVAFTPDATTLAAGTSTGQVSLFDVSQRTLAPLGTARLAGNDPVTGLAFAPDGTSLAASTENAGVKLLGIVWPNYDFLRRVVCGLVWRNLSRGEWSSLAPPGLAYRTACPSE